MGTTYNQKEFNKWNTFRELLRTAKSEKDYYSIIEICSRILELSQANKWIGILDGLFYKELGNAYLKIGENQNAVTYFVKAKDFFIQYRKNNKLSKPDDWLKDIELLEKKISKIKNT